MNNQGRIERINNAVNLLAFSIILVAATLVILHEREFGGMLASGAFGLLGGKGIATAANKSQTEQEIQNVVENSRAGNS